MRRVRGQAYRAWKKPILEYLTSIIAQKTAEAKIKANELILQNMRGMSSRWSVAENKPVLTEGHIHSARDYILKAQTMLRTFGIAPEVVSEVAEEMIQEIRRKEASKERLAEKKATKKKVKEG